MRLHFAVLDLALILAPQIAFSADVAYQIDPQVLAAPQEPAKPQPAPIVIADRVWATPGIEQATTELAPPRKFDFQKPRRLHMTVAVGVGWADIDGPDWLDDVAWPRTREWFHRNEQQQDGFMYVW